MVRAGSTLEGESMKPSTVRIGSVVSENTRHKDSFIYIVDKIWKTCCVTSAKHHNRFSMFYTQ